MFFCPDHCDSLSALAFFILIFEIVRQLVRDVE
jgi:hypothetical protein